MSSSVIKIAPKGKRIRGTKDFELYFSSTLKSLGIVKKGRWSLNKTFVGDGHEHQLIARHDLGYYPLVMIFDMETNSRRYWTADLCFYKDRVEMHYDYSDGTTRTEDLMYYIFDLNLEEEFKSSQFKQSEGGTRERKPNNVIKVDGGASFDSSLKSLLVHSVQQIEIDPSSPSPGTPAYIYRQHSLGISPFVQAFYHLSGEDFLRMCPDISSMNVGTKTDSIRIYYSGGLSPAENPDMFYLVTFALGAA